MFLTTSHFHLKVFGLHAKVKKFTEREAIGRLSLVSSTHAMSTSTYSNKHDSSRPRRVYFSSGPPPPLPMDASPRSSEDELEAAAAEGVWMQGFESSPSSSSSFSPNVGRPVSSAAVLMLPARIGAVSGSGKLPASWRRPASPVDSEEPALPSQAAPVVVAPPQEPAPVVVSAAPVVVVVQSWGLETGKHGVWPVLSVVSPPAILKAEPVSPSADCGVGVVDYMAVSSLVNSVEDIIPLPLPGMPPCKSDVWWHTSSQSVDVCRGPSGGHALAGDPRRHRPARI